MYHCWWQKYTRKKRKIRVKERERRTRRTGRLLPLLGIGNSRRGQLCAFCIYLSALTLKRLYLRSPYAAEWLANNTNRYLTRGNRKVPRETMCSPFRGERGVPIMTGRRRKWVVKVAGKLYLPAIRFLFLGCSFTLRVLSRLSQHFNVSHHIILYMNYILKY